MVTLIVGKLSNGKKCKIVSLNDIVNSENYTEFEVNFRKNIKPGEPKWANYVKGCVANFICQFVYYLNLF